MASNPPDAYHNTASRSGGHWRGTWLIGAAFLLAWLTLPPVTGRAERIFYRAKDWLATSPETQMRLVTGTHRAWEQEAETAEARGPSGERLSAAERVALRLLECIHVRPGLTLEEVRQAIQGYAGQHPEEIFSSFADLAARALERPCRAPNAR